MALEKKQRDPSTKTGVKKTKKDGDKKGEGKTPAKKTAPKKETAKKTSPKKQPAKKEGAKKPAAKVSAKKEKPKPAPLVVRASSRYVRVAPRKARLIADQVRGLQIDRARALIQFSPRSAAQDIGKLIESAAANAENNYDLVADEMRIAEITVDEGPTLRRFRPRALGRATPINKRTCHIAVALSPEGEL